MLLVGRVEIVSQAGLTEDGGLDCRMSFCFFRTAPKASARNNAGLDEMQKRGKLAGRPRSATFAKSGQVRNVFLTFPALEKPRGVPGLVSRLRTGLNGVSLQPSLLTPGGPSIVSLDWATRQTESDSQELNAARHTPCSNSRF